MEEVEEDASEGSQGLSETEDNEGLHLEDEEVVPKRKGKGKGAALKTPVKASLKSPKKNLSALPSKK